jgi:hypothetical protein
MRRRARCGLAAALLLASAAGAGAARAQEPVSAAEATAAASPSLPGSHWAVRAAWRAEALGLVPHFLPAQRAVPRGEVVRALREAAERAPTEAPWAAALARGWYDRFREEFSEARDTATHPAGPTLLGSRAWAGGVDRAGALSPGTSLRTTIEPPTPVAAERGAAAGAELALRLARPLTVVAAPAVGPGGARLSHGGLTAGAGAFQLAAGRDPIGYGEARGGSVVLSETVLDQLQLQTVRPLAPGGWLAWLGDVSLHASIGRLSEPRHAAAGDPYFFTGRAAFRPHPRLTLAVNRASMFGGDSVGVPLTAWNVARMMVGVYKGTYAFDNQVVSVSGRYRLPTDAYLPLTLYGEWGADDAAAGWRDVPARTLGLSLPALPLRPELALGLEYTRFAASCCSNPEWYRHGSFPGNWATHDRVLGHPLGGDGSEWRLYGAAELDAARLRLDADLFRRERGAENLYAPTRVGQSSGVQLRGAWRVLQGGEVGAGVRYEAGRGWRERNVHAVAVLLF